MRKRLVGLAGMIAALALMSASAFAASCPYCGQTYGEGSGSDSAYIARIRAEHEANCPMRPGASGSGSTGGSYGGGYNSEAWREWHAERAEAHYQAALKYFDDGEYDKAIARCSQALWHSWGNRTYRDLIEKAQARQRAKASADAAALHERLGNWDLSAMFYQNALKDYPGNADYEAGLARAKEGKRLALLKESDLKLAALSDEMSRSYVTPMLAFRGTPGDATSIDRIEVPSPQITEKHYYRIKTPRGWPDATEKVVTVTNRALVALQDSREWAREKAEEWTLGKVGGMLPGYETVTSLKDQFKERYEGYSKLVVGLAESDLSGVRKAVAGQTNPNVRATDTSEAQGEKVKDQAADMALDEIKGHVETEWEPDEADADAPGVTPSKAILLKRSYKHPDASRWGIKKWLTGGK